MVYSMLTRMEIANRLKINYNEYFVERQMELPNLIVQVQTYQGIDLNVLESKILKEEFNTIENDGIEIHVNNKKLRFLNVFNYNTAIFEEDVGNIYFIEDKKQHENGNIVFEVKTSYKGTTIHARLHPSLHGQKVPKNVDKCRVHWNNYTAYVIGFINNETTNEESGNEWEGEIY